MKRIILPVLLLVVPSLAHAVICKTVQPDGTVSYADVPAAECQQPVDLPDYSRYAPRPIQQQQWTRSSPTGGNLVRTERYTSMAIVKPGPGSTVRDNDGQVVVNIALQPGLQQNHKVMLYLDGAPVGSGFEGTNIELNGVRRGSHSLRAVVLDPSGQRLIEAPAVRFTLRQASLLEPARQPTEPPEPPKPGFPAEPGDGPPFAPGSGSDYAPPQNGGGSFQTKPGGIPSTPGATNPAFKPSFNP
jgi:hypothetical protein